MQIITSHTNLSFDGLASMIAAKKLYPQAELVLPAMLSTSVDQFLAQYNNGYTYKRAADIDLSYITQVILVDTNMLDQIEVLTNIDQNKVSFIVYDHHPLTAENIKMDDGIIEKTGATVTLLIEKIQTLNIKITQYDATVFALGIYSDTGTFTSSSTTSRDQKAAEFLLENGANLFTVEQYSQVPSLTAAQIMNHTVKVITHDTPFEAASKMLYRYEHTEFPIVENEKLIGIISRIDIEKAVHLGLGHAPVKRYMSRNPITISKSTTVEQIREKMIHANTGRLLVIENSELVGIITRSDVNSALHGSSNDIEFTYSIASPFPFRLNLKEQMNHHFQSPVNELLKLIGEEAAALHMNAYLIGGMVRDLLLNRVNEDIDIVVEGDGIAFAKRLARSYGGDIRTHEEFRTATWNHPSGFKIDMTSARTEYYEFPAALPKVEMATIKEDLYRRDFTVNALGICLHNDAFGQLIDYFNGCEDLKHKKLTVLYNLSFVEDPTRILRAIRFESRLSFSLDSQTFSLAKESANHLLSVSKLRLSNELSRLFFEEDLIYSYKRILELHLLPYLLKETAESKDVYKRLKKIKAIHEALFVKNMTAKQTIWICLFFSLSTLCKNALQEVETFCQSKEEHKTLHKLYSLLQDDLFQSFTGSEPLSKWHRHFANEPVEVLIAYLSLSRHATSTFINTGVDYLIRRETLNQTINGHDLIKNGLTPGPLFHELIMYAECIQIDHPSMKKNDLLKKVIDYQQNRHL
ncbi:CBS domain-containing protein [Evansella halocellulosilytica]|uniref:CBS domain-containing protein n=1 Tax=Evansella halocellulosilytica TaxID=2011013 RepID=UPI000BB763D1|nr:CBS domain-containing protein [Evansella halocellulosilytica]